MSPARRGLLGEGNLFQRWFAGGGQLQLSRTAVPVIIYQDGSQYIPPDSPADVRAFVSRRLPMAGGGLHRFLRLTPTNTNPLLITNYTQGGTGADSKRIRVAAISDRPTEAGQTELTSVFSQGLVTANVFSATVATANLPIFGEELFEATTQSGGTSVVQDFKWGQIIIPNGFEFLLWSTEDNGALDASVAWREYSNL